MYCISWCLIVSIPQLGALVINLSPSRLKGLFPGKTGPTKAMHMAFEVAREVSMAPVVIYIDECDQVPYIGYLSGTGTRFGGVRVCGRIPTGVQPPRHKVDVAVRAWVHPPPRRVHINLFVNLNPTCSSR